MANKYVLRRNAVVPLMAVEIVLFVLPLIICAGLIIFGLLDKPTDKPFWSLSIVTWPFIPFSLGVPFVFFYKRIWKKARSFSLIAKIAIIPFIPGWLWIFGSAVWIMAKCDFPMVALVFWSSVVSLICYLFVFLDLYFSKELAE